MPRYQIPITVFPAQRPPLQDLIRDFDLACEHLRRVSAKHRTRHQATLHAFAYRDLCRSGLQGLPAQYAVRAIARVSHQLRAAAHQLPDPYPPHSVDLDANCASLSRAIVLDPTSTALLPPEATLALSTLECRGLRGRNAQEARLRLSVVLPEDLRDPRQDLHFAGATLVIPPKGKPRLYASISLEPSPPGGQ